MNPRFLILILLASDVADASLNASSCPTRPVDPRPPPDVPSAEPTSGYERAPPRSRASERTQRSGAASSECRGWIEHTLAALIPPARKCTASAPVDAGVPRPNVSTPKRAVSASRTRFVSTPCTRAVSTPGTRAVSTPVYLGQYLGHTGRQHPGHTGRQLPRAHGPTVHARARRARPVGCPAAEDRHLERHARKREPRRKLQDERTSTPARIASRDSRSC